MKRQWPALCLAALVIYQLGSSAASGGVHLNQNHVRVQRQAESQLSHRVPRFFQDQRLPPPQPLPPPPPVPPPPPPVLLPPPAPARPHFITVPGTTDKRKDDQIVTQVIVPYDSYNYSASSESANSYVIDHKRFVESVNSRCFSSTLAEDPLSIEPTFVLIKPNGESRLNATVPAQLIQMSGFDPKLGTTIVVHGFTQSYPETEWLRKTRALFEMHALVAKHNLIIMNWGVASQGSYSQVAARASLMGSFLANFLMKLLDIGQDPMRVHLIGHSLGAHLAGFAGKRIRPRLGRITALDPAGPCFGKFFSNAPTDRLAPDDAFEVDVYHYDDGFLGLAGQHGQFDVFVNGGAGQPGCKANYNAMFNALVTVVFRRNRVLSESHTRSTEVATGQLSLSGCQHMAYECRDFAAFSAGECGKCDEQNNQCFFMGFPFQYSDPESVAVPLRQAFPGKKFYILTGQSEQFCANHHQILVKFEPTPEMAQLSKKYKWRIHAELINDSRGRVNVTITNQLAPNVFSFLLLTEASKPVRIIGAQLQVKNSDGSPVQIWHPDAPQIFVQKAKSPVHRILHMEVNFMSHINPQARRTISSRLCPATWSPMRPPPEMNSIGDPSWTQADAPLQFDECMSPPPPPMLKIN